ncbi:serine hydrolase [Sphingobacterium kyonggiense]|uniref:Serine hydrolase n=1 Tax=Sphingobacterium kyonggiense TaxID=714075 RepID=A0ABP7Y817_9SPHI
MKHLSILSIALMISMNLNAQQPLTAEQSDPKVMGWMQGFPPAKDRTVSLFDGTFFEFPALRYSVCHMREFFPTKVVKSADNDRYQFDEALDSSISKIEFMPLGEKKAMTFEESLAKNYTDGILILHKGKVVYERYFGELTADGTHAVMSVSKTFTGTLGAMLLAEGILDEHKLVKEYVPELANSAFGDATVRQVLDMTTSLDYSEDYADPKADVWIFSAAGNPTPLPKDYTGPTNYYEYLETVKKAGEHGKAFGYKTINTDAMGWIISKVTGKSIPNLLSERIWRPIGANFDGYYQIDRAGIAFAGGGFNANLRDLGMFGEMIRKDGYFNGKQVLPKAAIADIRKGGNQADFAKAGYSNLKNWSYRNMWWMSHNANGAFSARGVHGQTIYIDPKAEMVFIRLASHHTASNTANDPYSLPAYQAVADYLMKK